MLNWVNYTMFKYFALFVCLFFFGCSRLLFAEIQVISNLMFNVLSTEPVYLGETQVIKSQGLET